jgi:hypothetical protein
VAATDELEAAGISLASLQEALEQPEYQHRKSRERVEAAARAVLAGSLEGAVANLTRLKAQINEAYGAVWQLHRASFRPMGAADARTERHQISTFPAGVAPYRKQSRGGAVRGIPRSAESRMREIRTFGLMSGEGKRGDWQSLKPPRPSSTLQPRLVLVRATGGFCH